MGPKRNGNPDQTKVSSDTPYCLSVCLSACLSVFYSIFGIFIILFIFFNVPSALKNLGFVPLLLKVPYTANSGIPACFVSHSIIWHLCIWYIHRFHHHLECSIFLLPKLSLELSIQMLEVVFPNAAM